LTTRTFSDGRCSRNNETAASVSSVGMSPQHAITTSGESGESFDAHSQIPAPRVQWMTASSMDSQFHCGCLPATMTLTYCRERRQWSAVDSRVFASGGR